MRLSPIHMVVCFYGASSSYAQPKTTPPRYETRVEGKRTAKPSVVDTDATGANQWFDLTQASAGAAWQEVFSTAAGLRLRHDGARQGMSISLRGADPHQVAIFFDGVRIAHQGGSDGVDLALFDPVMLAGVHIQRSGSSAQFGSSAMGGAVHLYSPLTTTKTTGHLSLGYGAFHNIAGYGGLKSHTGRLRYMVSALYRQSDGDYSYIDNNQQWRTRDNNDRRMTAVLAKADYSVSAPHQLSIVNLFSWSAGGAPGMSERPSFTARQHVVQNMTALSWERRAILVPKGVWTATLHHQWRAFSFAESAPPPIDSRNQSFAIGAQASLNLPFETSFRLLGGTGVELSLFRDATRFDTPVRYVSFAWLSSQSLFFADRLLIAPAVRFELLNTQAPIASPKLGIQFNLPWQPIALYSNIGRSYRWPTFQELYVRLDGFGGNPQLRAEDALSWDIGVRAKWSWLQVDLAHFQRWMANTILFAPVSSFLVRADNYSDARAYGAEATATVTLPWRFGITGTYALTKTTIGANASQLPGHPPHRIAARVRYNGHHDRFNLWADISVQSAMYLSRFNTSEEEPRVMLATGGVINWRQFALSASGHNLLNKRDARDQVGFPIEPASFWVQLKCTL